MRKLTGFSVNYPITVLMLVLGILLLGFISFKKLGIDLFPDLNNPKIFVELEAGERPPEEIERQFVENIEALSIRQKKVTNVSSISMVGSAQVTVEYAWDADMDEAFLDLQKALSMISQNSDVEELNITQHDPNSTPVVIISLSHPEITDMDELRIVAENFIRNELIRLEGIAEVDILGGEEKQVVIETDNYLMAAHGVTPSQIASQIQGVNRNLSGGSIVEMGRQYVIKGIGEFQALDDIGNVIIAYEYVNASSVNASTTETGRVRVPVYLKDVAKISFINKEPENIVRVNQQRCAALAVYKETKFNTVKAVEALEEKLVELRKTLPSYNLEIINNQGAFITNAIDEVKQTALIGIVLAVIVLFVFLRRIGSTLIISVAIPISIVATFNLMYFNGLTLNIMTLGGLALGAGMLVDNAIVVVESIFRNLEENKSIKQAAIDGTAQVGGAIVASTITTIVVFLPIVYLQGAAGELFKDQAWTVAFSLLSSLVVAILVIPMLSTKFITPKQLTQKSISFPRYEKLLRKSLNNSGKIIWGSLVLVIVAVLLLPTIGSEFIPKAGLNKFDIELTLSEGTELTRTDNAVQTVEAMVYAVGGNHVKTVYGVAGPTNISSKDNIFLSENSATISVELHEESAKHVEPIIASLTKELSLVPDLDVNFIQDQSALQQTLGTDEAPIVIEIKGEDLAVLQELTIQAREKLNEVKDLYAIETSFDEGRPEVNVVLDRVRAGLLDVTIDQLSSQLQNQLLGTEAGQWNYNGEMRDIELQVPKISTKQLNNFELDISGQKVLLNEVAKIEMTDAAKEINRRNQSRVGLISAYVNEDKSFDKVIASVETIMQSLDLPENYTYKIAGEDQKRRESFDTLKFALILSIILVYMVMASQFESLVHPFTILLTIPLALVGAIFTFFILGKTLNIMAFIGIIMLVGIAVNDSIILVDAINQYKLQGLSRIEAIISAGQRRIRPIIMTSITTILALLPLTFGFGEGAALRSPMALAVIGGLITSTILTLVVIPCVYLKMDALTKN